MHMEKQKKSKKAPKNIMSEKQSELSVELLLPNEGAANWIVNIHRKTTKDTQIKSTRNFFRSVK